MALLQLKDIGKIYVSEGNVAVGIRGVNLTFERGEFVAITGKSGSGKSTLLNVISGIDTYEEGELYIEGQSTSHYLQPEWEEYRQKYISFIFQDYNIIESFTVLQNVELALMHIESKKERRRRALALLERVGLSSHIHHKGSRLSGGQKQRTVIARALAKDSPIILADEPTGNLDSATSAEIIELLREVSRDKLLIMVTHNYDQVEHCATRHIRVFDGAVESDQVMCAPEPLPETVLPEKKEETKQKKGGALKKGLILGRSIFTSRPKLSIFLCLLLIIGALGIFLITGYCGKAALLFQKYTMFTPMEGRVVLTSQTGEPLSDEKLAELASAHGAKDTLHYDAMLDEHNYAYVDSGIRFRHFVFHAVYDKTYEGERIGEYPKEAGEVFLYLPIYMQPTFGENELLEDEITLNGSLKSKITGVQYYYDNNLTPEVVFTKEGFMTATALSQVLDNSQIQINLEIRSSQGGFATSDYKIALCEGLAPDQVYLDLSQYQKEHNISKADEILLSLSVTNYRRVYNNYGGAYDSSEGRDSYVTVIDQEKILTKLPDGVTCHAGYTLYVSPAFVLRIFEEMSAESYRQASLFFENDKAAAEAIPSLKEQGYIAVLSNTEYEPPVDETLGNTLQGLLMAAVWLLAIAFLAFFVNLCSFRTLEAFKGDMAIMRSMGIPVKVIRVGMYVRMLIALIPACVAVVVAGLLVFRSPLLNEFFVYLYPTQYVLILGGLLLLTWRITRGQIRKLFRQSVKKSLRGGASE